MQNEPKIPYYQNDISCSLNRIIELQDIEH